MSFNVNLYSSNYQSSIDALLALAVPAPGESANDTTCRQELFLNCLFSILADCNKNQSKISDVLGIAFNTLNQQGYKPGLESLILSLSSAYSTVNSNQANQALNLLSQIASANNSLGVIFYNFSAERISVISSNIFITLINGGTNSSILSSINWIGSIENLADYHISNPFTQTNTPNIKKLTPKDTFQRLPFDNNTVTTALTIIGTIAGVAASAFPVGSIAFATLASVSGGSAIDVALLNYYDNLLKSSNPISYNCPGNVPSEVPAINNGELTIIIPTPMPPIPPPIDDPASPIDPEPPADNPPTPPIDPEPPVDNPPAPIDPEPPVDPPKPVPPIPKPIPPGSGDGPGDSPSDGPGEGNGPGEGDGPGEGEGDGEGGCFVAGTPVLLSDHSFMPVELISSGTKVLAVDLNGNIGISLVIDVIISNNKPTHKIHFEDNSVVESSQKQQFIVLEKQISSPKLIPSALNSDTDRGKTLKTLNGSIKINNIEKGEPKTVYYLKLNKPHVAYFSSFKSLHTIFYKH